MAISEAYSGSATVSTTEYSLTANSTTLGSVTTDGVYQVFLDCVNMVAGDQYELKIYEKATSGASQRVCHKQVLTGAQSPPLIATPALILLHGWEVSLDKLSGTDRSFNWSIRSVA